MRKIIARTLIVVGVLIVCISTYTNYKVEESNNEVVNQYEKIIETNSNNKLENTKLPEGIIGILKIPKIDLKVAVQEGTDDDTLKYAVGHFKETAMPGEVGNFAVAGHRAYTYNKFFSNLDKVELGDKLDILTSKGEYTYKVTSSEVIKPEQVEVLENEENKETITLITCTPKYVGSHRLVIKGEKI
ncbi:MAG: class D sortase [Bacilli bacterium]